MLFSHTKSLQIALVICIDPSVCFDLIFTNLHLTLWLKSILDCCTEVLFLSSGFWVVSTSEDDVSELKSDESNPEEVEWEEEKDNNDLEVMNILSQIERVNELHTDHTENDIMIKDNDSHESALAEEVSKYLIFFLFDKVFSINGHLNI